MVWHRELYPISCNKLYGRSMKKKIYVCLFHSLEELFLEAHSDYSLKNDYPMNLGQFLRTSRKNTKVSMFSRYYLVSKAKLPYETMKKPMLTISLSYISINKTKIKGLVAVQHHLWGTQFQYISLVMKQIHKPFSFITMQL